MKIFTKSTLSSMCGLIAMMTVLFCLSIETSAQGTAYVGYVSPKETVYPYTGYSNSSDQDLTLIFTIRVEASKLENFNGASLTGLHIGWSMGAEETFPEIEAFVREELDGENLASGKDQIGFGWYDVMFDTPYTITSDKDIYIGATVEWPKGAWLGTGIFGYNIPKKSQFIGNLDEVGEDGKILWIDDSSGDRAILALGIVEASGNEFNDKALLTGVYMNDVQPTGVPGDAYLTIKNEGLNNLQSFEISSSFNGKSWSYPIELDNPIQPGEQKYVSGGVQALGTGIHNIWLSKVNGNEVKNATVVEKEIIGVPDDVAAQYTRRPLVERWVSEDEYRTPYYTDSIFMPGLNPYRDQVSMVAHHLSDQFMIYHEFDKDVDNEDVQFLVDFANGEKKQVSVPAFATDRSYLPRNPLATFNTHSIAYDFIYPNFASPVYESALKVPTFASVNTSVQSDGNECEIEVYGKIEPGIMPEGESLYMTVYVIEDGIVSTSQEFPDSPELEAIYKGVYTHNDVIRLSLTEMYGDKIESEGEFSKKFTCELEPEWNRDNMRVVAFLNRSGERHGHMQVINSVETGLKANSVKSIESGALKSFAIEGHDIVAAPGYGIEVYTLDGTRVSASGLRPGIYIVKTSGTNSSSACKVTVK